MASLPRPLFPKRAPAPRILPPVNTTWYPVISPEKNRQMAKAWAESSREERRQSFAERQAEAERWLSIPLPDDGGEG